MRQCRWRQGSILVGMVATGRKDSHPYYRTAGMSKQITWTKWENAARCKITWAEL